MKKRKYFIFIMLLFFSHACFSQQGSISVAEQKNIDLFNDFKNYLVNTINKREDINDNVHLKYVLLHYIFINKQLDSADVTTLSNNKLTESQLNSLKKELNIFYTYLQEHQKDHLAENLTLKPIRLSNDTFTYNQLTNFQKENTFILFDKRYPDKTLGYILFIPPLKNKLAASRIWSWTLMFKFGKYMFKSLTGEEGYEYIFNQ